MVNNMAVLGLDLRRFAIQVIGGLIGGWVSETVVTRPELVGIFGEYATPVAGSILSLLGQYLETRGTLPRDIARLLEYAGAFTVGNWIYEYIKRGVKGTSYGTKAVTVYVPPVEVKRREAIVL